jgi:hypothetical protein
VETLLQNVCNLDKCHKLFHLLTVGRNIIPCQENNVFPPALRTRGIPESAWTWMVKKRTPVHIRNQPQLSLSHSHTITLLTEAHSHNDSISKLKYWHDRTNYSYIFRIIFITRSSNKCQNAQWDALVSNGGFCSWHNIHTKLLVLSHHKLKLSSSVLCFVL